MTLSVIGDLDLLDLGSSWLQTAGVKYIFHQHHLFQLGPCLLGQLFLVHLTGNPVDLTDLQFQVTVSDIILLA